MSKQDEEKTADQGISKVKLALGAASLFLFIIGVKRTFQMEQPEGGPESARRSKGAKAKGGKESRKRSSSPKRR